MRICSCICIVVIFVFVCVFVLVSIFVFAPSSLTLEQFVWGNRAKQAPAYDHFLSSSLFTKRLPILPGRFISGPPASPMASLSPEFFRRRNIRGVLRLKSGHLMLEMIRRDPAHLCSELSLHTTPSKHLPRCHTCKQRS